MGDRKKKVITRTVVGGEKYETRVGSDGTGVRAMKGRVDRKGPILLLVISVVWIIISLLGRVDDVVAIPVGESQLTIGAPVGSLSSIDTSSLSNRYQGTSDLYPQRF